MGHGLDWRQIGAGWVATEQSTATTWRLVPAPVVEDGWHLVVHSRTAGWHGHLGPVPSVEDGQDLAEANRARLFALSKAEDPAAEAAWGAAVARTSDRPDLDAYAAVLVAVLRSAEIDCDRARGGDVTFRVDALDWQSLADIDGGEYVVGQYRTRIACKVVRLTVQRKPSGWRLYGVVRWGLA